MGTYYIPRDVKGETRFFKIFSVKALLYTVGFAFVGLILKTFIDMLGVPYAGLIILIVFALFGFVIGTFKLPNNNLFKICKVCGGEKIDEILKRAIMFKKERKIYVNGKGNN